MKTDKGFSGTGRDGWARANLPASLVLELAGEWFASAHPGQYPLGIRPPAWLVIGGRGSGKTRLGAQWVRGLVLGHAPFSGMKYGRIALVGETLGDVREVMIDGPSGIRAISGEDRPRYEPTRRRLLWDNGAVAQAFSSEDPDSLRGPQFDAAWCDELAKWKNMETVFDMLQFGLRLGESPRQLFTTTPRPVPLVKRLACDPDIHVTRLRTMDNTAHLAAGFLAAVQARYGGTRLGRQELDGEIIGDREGALWSRDAIEEACTRRFGAAVRIVVAVDPPAGSGKGSDACGIVAAGVDGEGRATVLADASVEKARPHEWAAAAIRLYHALEADCLLAEVNQGGEMVASVIASVDKGVPVKSVRATRGKFSRAEPVSALYQQGRVAHAARFPALEDEMCDFTAAGLSSGRSPDRMDALVWALSELLLSGPGRSPRIRHV
ncbi:DNA-packaging protein [Zhengella sp. ZM62]|uniref:DNA-packaging protein n=1 Tax=Zhengella sedimenti TaxID=3390035 RepID=UPI003975C1D4